MVRPVDPSMGTARRAEHGSAIVRPREDKVDGCEKSGLNVTSIISAISICINVQKDKPGGREASEPLSKAKKTTQLIALVFSNTRVFVQNSQGGEYYGDLPAKPKPVYRAWLPIR
jgi:hypothetical protein